MKRGDLVLTVPKGDYAKPRPAVVIQSDWLSPEHPSIIVCFITSDLQDALFYRSTLEPTTVNGLTKQSQIMIDKIQTLPRERIKKKLGSLTHEQLHQLDRSLALIVGLTG